MAKHDPSASRDNFRSKWGFKLACIGSAVGMGNIWLFPSRMSQYGATFLIPYFLFVALIASTGVIGEMAFGRAAAQHLKQEDFCLWREATVLTVPTQEI